MKFIRVQITDDLHSRLKALSTHHGEFTHLVRKAIRKFVTDQEQLSVPKEQPNVVNSTNIPKPASKV